MEERAEERAEEEEEDVSHVVLPLFSSSGCGGRYHLRPMGIDILVRTRTFSAPVRVPGVEAASSAEPSLFVDALWPGALFLADYLGRHPSAVRGLTVLELGAGAGLPSLVSCKLGASRVVVTDYPAAGVVENLRELLADNGIAESLCEALPHVWGQDPGPLLSLLPPSAQHGGEGGFDVLLLAELLWQDTAALQPALLQSVLACLGPHGVALVSFAHRPTAAHSPAHDLRLFDLAAAAGLSTALLETNATDYCDDSNGIGEGPVPVHLYAMRRTA